MPSHLLLANKAVDDLSKQGRNTFGPGLPFLIVGPTGIVEGAHTRCSSFVTLLLRESYALSARAMRRFFGRASPYAADYYEAILRSDLDERHSMKAIIPGDLLCIDYEGGFNDLGFTGHSAIVASFPVLTGNPLGKGLIWEVEVVDSSLSSHGPGDTRFYSKNGVDHETGGIGRGKMQVVADERGAILGYTWSVRGSSPLMVNGKGQTIRFAGFPADW